MIPEILPLAFKPSILLKNLILYSKGDDGQYHIIYIVINLVNGKFYVGYHTTKNINDGYLGSGSRMLKVIKKYGSEKLFRLDCEFYRTKDDMKMREKEIVDEKFIEDYKDDCYNFSVGGGEGWDSLHKSPRAKEIYKLIGKKNSKLMKELYNRMTSEEKEKFREKQRKISNRPDVIAKKSLAGKNQIKNMTEGEKLVVSKKLKKNMENRTWINNGERNLRIKNENLSSYLSSGWKLKMIFYRTKSIHRSLTKTLQEVSVLA